MYKDIEFISVKNTLRGRMYSHGTEPTPCIIMAHGTSATITMVADSYADAFHKAGFNVLLFDHANFGDSDGEPRYEINPWVQGRGYRDAVSYMRASDSPSKLALWGDSYSAMTVLVASSCISGLSAVIAQIPACGAELPSLEPSQIQHDKLKRIFHDGDVSGNSQCTTGPIPVVSSDQINTPSLLTPIQAYRWFIEYGGRYGTQWENRVTRVIPLTEVPYNAYLAAPYITAPILIMSAKGDEMVHCNASVQRAVFDNINTDKTFYKINGGHFGLLWHPGKIFDEAVAQQITFLRQTLH